MSDKDREYTDTRLLTLNTRSSFFSSKLVGSGGAGKTRLLRGDRPPCMGVNPRLLFLVRYATHRIPIDLYARLRKCTSTWVSIRAKHEVQDSQFIARLVWWIVYYLDSNCVTNCPEMSRGESLAPGVPTDSDPSNCNRYLHG